MALDTDLMSKLQAVIDKQEIYDGIMRYCRGIDRADEELVRSVYHPDAIDEHGESMFTGQGWEFASWVSAGGKRNPYLGMHAICNVLIELEGATAFVESYALIHLRQLRADGKEYDDTSGTRYIDRWERRDGEWKIARRVVVRDWNRIDPVAEIRADWTKYIHGQKSREDLAFQRV